MNVQRGHNRPERPKTDRHQVLVRMNVRVFDVNPFEERPNGLSEIVGLELLHRPKEPMRLFAFESFGFGQKSGLEVLNWEIRKFEVNPRLTVMFL